MWYRTVSLNKFSSNYTFKIICVVCAIALWFNIATKSRYNHKIYIPIRYTDPSSGYMLASTPPERIYVDVSGSGKQLMLLMLKNIVYPDRSYVTVNLAEYPKGRHLVYLDKEKIVLFREEKIRIESILYNSYFPVVIDKKVKRTVPVDMAELPDLEMENGFVLNGAPVARPEFAIIEGPEDIVSTIGAVKIQSLAKTVLSLADTLVQAHLDTSIRFSSVSPSEIAVYFPVEPLRTKLFRTIPLTYRGFRRSARPTLIPDTLSVMIQGPESIVSRSRAEDIRIEINYPDYSRQVSQGDSLIKPEILYPEGITSVTITPGVLRVPVR